LVLAWIVVTAWFGLATFAIAYLVAALTALPQQHYWVAVPTSLLKWRVVEAGLLTLTASLWFASIGSGQWWLLFFLIGALATVSIWYAVPPAGTPKRALIAGAVAYIGRYVIAGGLLAWRLS
jgi:hypothetical protein